MTKGDWDDQRRLRMTGMIGDDYEGQGMTSDDWDD